MAKQNLAKAYGDATGPFNFPMPSDLARMVEKLVREMPGDLRSLAKSEVDGEIVEGYCRVYSTKAPEEINTDERSEVSIVTNRAVDRDFEVIDPKGVDWSHFKKNPVVPFSHDYRKLPVGRAAWIKRHKSDKPEEDGFKAKTIYFKQPPNWTGDWMPDALWHLIGTEKLPMGKSVGFVPIEGRAPTPSDLKKDPALADAMVIFTKVLVLEYSVTPIPANQGALVTAINKARDAGHALPEDFLGQLGLFAAKEIDVSSFIEEGEADEPEPVQQKTIVTAANAPATYEGRRKAAESRILTKLADIDLDGVVEKAIRKHRGQL